MVVFQEDIWDSWSQNLCFPLQAVKNNPIIQSHKGRRWVEIWTQSHVIVTYSLQYIWHVLYATYTDLHVQLHHSKRKESMEPGEVMDTPLYIPSENQSEKSTLLWNSSISLSGKSEIRKWRNCCFLQLFGELSRQSVEEGCSLWFCDNDPVCRVHQTTFCLCLPYT